MWAAAREQCGRGRESGSGRLIKLHAQAGERWLVSAARWARVSEAMKLRRASRAIDARPSVAVLDVSDDAMVTNLGSFRASRPRWSREVPCRLLGLTACGLGVRQEKSLWRRAYRAT